MGDLAQDRFDGACCFYCGIYFREKHGYVVLCHDCYTEEMEETKGDTVFEEAQHKEM